MRVASAALIVSSVIFGFIHITEPSATLWSSVSIAVEAGLLLGAAYKYSGTLWFPIGIHWAWNFTQGNIVGFEVSGNDAGAALLKSTVSGPDWLTGGGFGAEASVIPVLLGLILSAWYIWKIETV
jgi:membrane protease YdiL (CAAX protease family)